MYINQYFIFEIYIKLICIRLTLEIKMIFLDLFFK